MGSITVWTERNTAPAPQTEYQTPVIQPLTLLIELSRIVRKSHMKVIYILKLVKVATDRNFDVVSEESGRIVKVITQLHLVWRPRNVGAVLPPPHMTS